MATTVTENEVGSNLRSGAIAAVAPGFLTEDGPLGFGLPGQKINTKQLYHVRGLVRAVETNDGDLVKRAGQGDQLAASQLVLMHTDKIMAASYRVLGDRAAAEDATQETFLRLWKHAATWQEKGVKIETWLYRVAVNICLDRLRRKKREAPEDAAPEQVDTALRADEELMTKDRARIVEQAISQLPERQRVALTLAHYQELSNIETADIMGVSVEAVESLLSRARRALRQALTPHRNELLQGSSA